MSHVHLTNVVADQPDLLATTAHPASAPAAAEAQLRAINHRLVSAYAVADSAYIDTLLANDFLFTSTSGDWIDRKQYLELMLAPSIAGGVSYDDVRVRLFGSVAVLHGVFEAGGDQAVAVCIRYTDVYHWNGASWHLVNTQHTALRQGVEKRQELGHAPASAPWLGQDPTGDDHEVLRELNANYVRAFREADVDWYAAHLTQDYVVINSDGSFHDRARGLAEFAKPAFATYMRSFPVDKVRIRRFDQFALIHAENAYERKDGLKGVNRYTDIWQEDDGRWRCVAAHITTHKAPGQGW